MCRTLYHPQSHTAQLSAHRATPHLTLVTREVHSIQRFSRCFLFLSFAIVTCQHQKGVCRLWVICFLVLFLLLFLVSVWFLVCACRSRWSPCMSHEALSGHICNLPSFLPPRLVERKGKEGLPFT